MKVGDLVRIEPMGAGVGIITEANPYDYYVVLFSGVRYSFQGVDLELISEGR